MVFLIKRTLPVFVAVALFLLKEVKTYAHVHTNSQTIQLELVNQLII